MEKDMLDVQTESGQRLQLPMHKTHTLVIGSGAAGLNAALQLTNNGIDDVLIITEGLQMGTSINTGSDKQTYYKLGMCGAEPDAIESVAAALYNGGSMHGDLAMVEASLSARGFLNLVNLGVPFPRDSYGQFVGYKTDHDPRQRATSVGPYTSREMCRCLIREIVRRGIAVRENRIAVSLLTVAHENKKRVAGAIVLNCAMDTTDTEDLSSIFEVYAAENVVFATGGPGGLYQTSVYPKVHTGGIGLALLSGATSQNLPESQYGLASVKFRWNVSGSFMQVVPRFISTNADSSGPESEFMRDYFDSVGAMNSAVFLKGYQWPFDSKRIVGGSSIVDILVYIETVVKGRRVFLDYRSNPEGFHLDDLNPEARDYLTKSQATGTSPIERLEAMNPDAIQLYRHNDIDIAVEPLEIAVCAQHNNGGLAANMWWESINIKHLFPVGEVNGTHGVKRPGGSALNAGQVGGFRAAEYIAHRYPDWTLDAAVFEQAAAAGFSELAAWMAKSKQAPSTWMSTMAEFQSRMTNAAAHIRSLKNLQAAVKDGWAQWRQLQSRGCAFKDLPDLRAALTARQLCYAHVIYLEAVLFAVMSNLGSRGSAMVLGSHGDQAHPRLGSEWNFVAENPEFQTNALETRIRADGSVSNHWVECRPLPKTDAWFETTWAAFKKGDIYR
jgi:succinate dehydrogenase/fumarate reductase flavoprotein subunit